MGVVARSAPGTPLASCVRPAPALSERLESSHRLLCNLGPRAAIAVMLGTALRRCAVAATARAMPRGFLQSPATLSPVAGKVLPATACPCHDPTPPSL